MQYEGTVKADEGTVAYDRVQLEYCHIVSSIEGRVGLRLVDPGNTVFAGSNSTLAVITELQQQFERTEHAVTRTYIELGYRIVTLPLISPVERADFILSRSAAL